MLATDLVRRKLTDEARRNLQAVAYMPHGGPRAAAAQRVLDRMDAQPDWDGEDVTAVLATGEADGPETEAAK
jgi:hypothetical protein